MSILASQQLANFPDLLGNGIIFDENSFILASKLGRLINYKINEGVEWVLDFSNNEVITIEQLDEDLYFSQDQLNHVTFGGL